MERILSVKEMRAADEYTVSALGISEDVLTERAAAAVADEIIKRLHGGRVLVCVGAGHNGEDGKIIARILSAVHGFTVAVMNVSGGMLKLFHPPSSAVFCSIFCLSAFNPSVDCLSRPAFLRSASSACS